MKLAFFDVQAVWHWKDYLDEGTADVEEVGQLCQLLTRKTDGTHIDTFFK
jgi:hypothetical protein